MYRILDITVQDLQDRYPDHQIVIRNGFSGNVFGDYLLEEVPELSSRYIMSYEIYDGYINVYVSVHSRIEVTFEPEETECIADEEGWN